MKYRSLWSVIFFLLPTFLITSYGLGTTGDTGTNSLVKFSTLEVGEACPNGGIQINSGNNGNENKLIDVEEIAETSVICSEIATKKSLINSSKLDIGVANYPQGGTLVRHGIDANNNIVFDENEITENQHICNSANRTKGDKGTDSNQSLISTTTLTFIQRKLPNKWHSDR